MENKYPVQFESSCPLPKEDEIQASEKRLGVVFPDDYRTFLLTVNGGAPSPERVKVPGTKHAVHVDFLYSVRDTRRSGDIEYEQELIQTRTEHTIPDGFIVIGRDPGGHPFFIGTKGDTAGHVYFLDARAFFHPKRSKKKLYRVADTFSKLIEAMDQQRERD